MTGAAAGMLNSACETREGAAPREPPELRNNRLMTR
jgi:hypothetical protein